MIEALLAAGADPMARDEIGFTPLHFAAATNANPAVIEALLAAGADLEARSRFGRMPLHNAAENNENPAVLEALLAAGADLEAQWGLGTSLHMAAGFSENPAVLEILLAAGADLEAQDEDGHTPLHWAAAFAYYRVHAGRAIEALLDAGANAMARNAAGETSWDLAQANEALQGTDGYRQLNDAQLDAPRGDTGRPSATPTAR